MKKTISIIILFYIFFTLCSCNSDTVAPNQKTARKIVDKSNSVIMERPFNIVKDGLTFTLTVTGQDYDFRDLYENDEYKKYFDYEKAFLPFVEIDEKYDENNIFYRIKGYDRYTYGKDSTSGDPQSESFVKRTLHTFTVKIENPGDKVSEFTAFPTVKVIFTDDDGNQSFDENIYLNAHKQTEFDNQAVYLDASKYPTSKNRDEYLTADIDPFLPLEANLKYVIDNDLFVSSYLCFPSDQGDKYFRIYR